MAVFNITSTCYRRYTHTLTSICQSQLDSVKPEEPFLKTEAELSSETRDKLYHFGGPFHSKKKVIGILHTWKFIKATNNVPESGLAEFPFKVLFYAFCIYIEYIRVVVYRLAVCSVTWMVSN